MPTTDERLAQLEQQQSLTVATLRNVLKGEWDQARMFLDAIDPDNAGTWTNVAFPKA